MLKLQQTQVPQSELNRQFICNLFYIYNYFKLLKIRIDSATRGNHRRVNQSA